MQKITLDEIIAIANKNYGFAGLAKGDLLADFIAQELKDSYWQGNNRTANLVNAATAMDRAITQLQAVADKLWEASES